MEVTLIGGGDLTPPQIGAWRAFQKSSAAYASPFLCPEFTLAVAAVRDDVAIAVLEDDDHLLGFFPFQIGSGGQGVPVGDGYSDYHAVIARPGGRWTACELIRSSGLHSWRFDHLITTQASFRPYYHSVHRSPYLDLAKGFEKYARERRAVGSSLVSRLQLEERRLARDVGKVSIELHSPSRAILDLMMDWKSEQCRRRGWENGFQRYWVVRLFERLHACQNSDFASVLSVLRAGDEVVALHFGLRSHLAWHYWFPCYHPGYASYSPGLILLLRMAQMAPALGVHWIDLGRGRAAYKQRFRSADFTVAQGEVRIR